MSVFPFTRFAVFRRPLLLLIGGIASVGLLACEGPAGPQGPEGPQGEQGPPGAAGTDPSIINLDLTDHVENTTFDRGSNTLTPEDDTLSIKWGATMDTTITSVTIADSQYAEIYVRVPGVGFQRAPIRFNFDGAQNVSNVVREADPFAQVEYDLLEQLPSPSRDSFFTAEAVGGSDRRFYTAVLASSDIHEAIVEPDRFTATVRAYDAVAGSNYEGGLNTEGFTQGAPDIPFDSDLSDSSVNTYPNAGSNGIVTYRQSTTDLSAVRNAFGSDLRLGEGRLQAIKEEPVGTFGRVTDVEPPNPRPGQVEVRAVWGRDSISVAGVMIGTNYGRDRTIYTQKIPVDVRVAIVGGDLANKMRSGEAVPFSEIREAAARR
jgi:hypothetical protein